MSTQGRDEPPNTWPGNSSAWLLDEDRYVMWVTRGGWPWDENGRDVLSETALGLLEWHWDPLRDQWCGGYIGFLNRDNHSGSHKLVSVSPLHIEPSLLCNHCPDHGWIRGGRWVSA